MERLEREIERITWKYSRVIKTTSGKSDRNDKGWSSEENERKIKKIMISYSVFFTQNQLSFKPKDIYEMEVDDLLITYEMIIQQVEEQRKISDAIKNG